MVIQTINESLTRILQTTIFNADKEETKTESSTKNVAGLAMVVGEEYEKMVQNIVDMEYERSKAVAALKASFNNAERAIEYLVSGMPTMGEMEDSLPTVGSHTHTEATASPSTLFSLAI